MPNWCVNYIDIRGKAEEITALYNLIEEWTSKESTPTAFRKKWLGNIVNHSGIGTVDTGADTDIFCRGYLSEMDDDEDGLLLIQTETAWNPAMKMWDMVCKKYLTEYSLIYSAEECGEELYYTNDPELKDKYICKIDDESDREASKEYVFKELRKVINRPDLDDDELYREYAKDKEAYPDIYIAKWETVNVSELS